MKNVFHVLHNTVQVSVTGVVVAMSLSISMVQIMFHEQQMTMNSVIGEYSIRMIASVTLNVNIPTVVMQLFKSKMV